MESNQTFNLELAKPGFKIFSNEFMISVIFFLGIFNNYIAEILKLWELKGPTNVIYTIIYIYSLIAWLKSSIYRSFFTFSILLTFFGLVLFAADQSVIVHDYVFNFGSGSIAEIGNSNFAIFTGLCLPPFLLFNLDVDYKALNYYFLKFSKLNLVLFIAMMCIQVFGFGAKISYMNVAYNAAPGFMILYYHLRNKARFDLILLCAATFFFLVIGGCRGALLSIIVFVVFYEIYLLKHLTAGVFFTILIFLVLALFVIFNIESIVLTLDDFLLKFGYNSRLLNKFLDQSADGDLFQYSDRQRLIDAVWREVGFFGDGIYGDRKFLDGRYVHNFFIEIFSHYGLFFGGIISVATVIFVLVARNKAKQSNVDFLYMGVLSFICTLFVKMQFSSSYLIDRPFWMYLGMCIMVLKTIKNQGEFI